jgi:hypothetical protein
VFEERIFYIKILRDDVVGKGVYDPFGNFHVIDRFQGIKGLPLEDQVTIRSARDW